jgi:hypothetical protein
MTLRDGVIDAITPFRGPTLSERLGLPARP